MGQPVVHWEIAGKVAKKLQGFYADLFDWKVKTWKPDPTSPMEYGMVQTGGQAGRTLSRRGSRGSGRWVWGSHHPLLGSVVIKPAVAEKVTRIREPG